MLDDAQPRAVLEQLVQLRGQVARALDDAAETRDIPTFRGHLGPNWLSLITSSPQSSGALPAATAEVTVGYFTELLNVSSFNFAADKWVLGIKRKPLRNAKP